jgi:hypothetical protein
MQYGVDGLRSYLLDEGGTLRWTAEDREAATTDPLVAPCEPKAVCRFQGDLSTMEAPA